MKKHYAKYLIFSLIALWLSVLQTQAQTKTGNGKVAGTVTDEKQQPLDFATVSLLKAKDSTLVKTAMTDLAGKYLFEKVAPGEYLISSSMVGFKKAFSQTFSIKEDQAEITINALQMFMNAQNLKEVSIVAQKPFVERKMDKLVVNVESSSLSAGNTAMEVLEKAPGVTIDKDDNISMKGKQGVLIMLDGKPTYMSSADVANMLRNMQSNQIESIELITSPSARYEAAGASGIINIKTKKSKNMGLNGTLTAGSGYGETSKYNGGTTLNYRQGKLNVFGNYNYGNNGRINNLDLDRKVTYRDTITQFQQLNNWNTRRNNNSFKGGADYFINKNHTIGLLVNGYFNKSNNSTNSFTGRSNNFQQIENINILGNSLEQYQNVAYNLNYKGVLDTVGSELSVDLDYSNYQGKQDEIRDNIYSAINLQTRNPLSVKNYAPATIGVKSVKIDYSHPFNKTTKLETGIKSSLVKTDNDLLLAKLQNGTWVPDADYTNHFLYDENINAAYINFSKEFKKFGLQAGLRAEHTHSKGNSVTKNQVVDRNYLEFFPSLSLSHTINKNNSLGFSYSRRINRPGYDALNPFLQFLDEYTYQKGNPYLNPEFTNSFDLSHTFKGSFTTSLSYSHTTNVMTTVTEQDDVTQKTVAIERNLDEQSIYGLNIYAPVPVAKWWNINNNVQVFHMSFKSKSNNGNLNTGQMAFSYNMDHSFIINKTFTAELSARYMSPLQYGIFRIESPIVIGAGLKKSFMNNKMNIRLNMSDLFNQQKQRVATTYQNMDLQFTQKNETRIGRLTLTYRFGKNEIKGARKRSTGLEDEASRMKN